MPCYFLSHHQKPPVFVDKDDLFNDLMKMQQGIVQGMALCLFFIFTEACGAIVPAGDPCVDGPVLKGTDPWEKAEEICRMIEAPVIPERVFRLEDFGGRAGGARDNKKAFDRMIAACAEQGGGRMIVDRGTWLVKGPIHLQSHMELHLAEGARLVFGDDPADYLPVVPTSWEGTRLYNYSPFIYVRGATDVVLSGRGEIDGNAAAVWHHWKARQEADKRLSRRMNNEDLPVEERVFGEGHYLRPHLIQFYECERIRVEDLHITDAPFWCLHLVFSKHIHIRGLSYDAHNYNNDGIDPESSQYVLIEDVDFNNADDNIAIKAGRDLEGRTLGRAASHIVVRNCRFKGHNAIAVGSEMSGGVHDVYVEHCKPAGRVAYGFYLKGNRDRGGEVRDIHARHIRFDTTLSPLIIDSNYKNQGSSHPPAFRNIFVSDLKAHVALDHGIYLKGYQERPLDSIVVRGLRIDQARIPVEATAVRRLWMEGVVMDGQNYPVAGGHAEMIRGLSPETGRPLWQISADTAPATACYFEGQAFSGDERYVVYVSRRSGVWQLYRANLHTGIAVPLTSAAHPLPGPDDYSVMPDGERVCIMREGQLLAIDLRDGREELLYDLRDLPGTPLFSGSFTRDGRYTLAYVRSDRQPDPAADTLTAIYRIDLQQGSIEEIHRQRGGKISHPLLNPADKDMITYVPGPDTQNDMSLPMEERARTWRLRLREGSNRPFLTAPYGFRATHESWAHDGRRFYYYRKTRPGWSPVAICSQDSAGRDTRIHYESDTIRLGHGTVSRDGRWFVSDSQEPGQNELVLVDLQSGKGRVLCWPNASISAGHSKRAHVHPSFSPHAAYITYTSDSSGVSQVYVVPVDDLTARRRLTTHKSHPQPLLP